LSALAADPGTASALPPAGIVVARFSDIGRAIAACWMPPVESGGSSITLRFGIDSTGALRGPPVVTSSKLFGSVEAQHEFAVAALRAVADCTPLRLDPAFAPVVAGRVVALRFMHTDKTSTVI
jgi:hypothetical protein